jgi:hypothetical protein
MSVTAFCDAKKHFAEIDAAGLNLDIGMKDPAAVPWFYSPGASWFEVTSNISAGTLRTRSLNLSITTQCHDTFYVVAQTSLTLRVLCPRMTQEKSCFGSMLNATSPNITHFAILAARRASYASEEAPTDLFDSANAGYIENRDVFSDFACAGPNRFWPHADENAHVGPDAILITGNYNMCVMQNACLYNKQIVLFLPEHFEELQRHGFFSFPNVHSGFAPIAAKYYGRHLQRTPNFIPKIVFSSVPESARFAANITHYAMQRHFSGSNFGHTVWEDLGGIFHAMHTFSLPREDGRIVLFNDHTISRAFPPFFPRRTAYIDEFPDGTCFGSMVVGFAGVGSFSQGFSLYRSAHNVEFRKYYLSLWQAENLVSKTRLRPRIIVNVYPKVVIGNGHVWSDICTHILQLSVIFPKVSFRCISLNDMSFEVQSQVISEAAVHIWPNGTRRTFFQHSSMRT